MGEARALEQPVNSERIAAVGLKSLRQHKYSKGFRFKPSLMQLSSKQSAAVNKLQRSCHSTSLISSSMWSPRPSEKHRTQQEMDDNYEVPRTQT